MKTNLFNAETKVVFKYFKIVREVSLKMTIKELYRWYCFYNKCQHENQVEEIFLW